MNLVTKYTFLFFTIFMVFLTNCNNVEEQTQVEESETCLVEIDGDFIDIQLDEKPEYLNGGKEGFINNIGTNINYPAEARENGIEGICIVQYEINEEGEVENMSSIMNPGGGIGESAIQSIKDATNGISFKPGILDGNSKRVRKEIQIKYRLV